VAGSESAQAEGSAFGGRRPRLEYIPNLSLVTKLELDMARVRYGFAFFRNRLESSGPRCADHYRLAPPSLVDERDQAVGKMPTNPRGLEARDPGLI
jgi:hypothetical protein